MIINYMEAAIDHLMPKVLESFPEICQCEKCQEDIKAMTLNKVKPLYSVTNKGNMYLKIGEEMELQFKTDIMTQIIKSIQVVSKNVMHD